MILSHSSPSLFSRLLTRTMWTGPAALSMLFLLLPFFASGCGKAEKKSTMAELVDKARQEKIERDKWEEKLKETEHNLEQLRTAKLTASIGYIKQKDLKREVQQPGKVVSYENTPIYTYIPGWVDSLARKPLIADPAASCASTLGLLAAPLSSGALLAVPLLVSDRQIDMGDFVTADEVLAILYVPERDQDVVRKKAMVYQAEAELILAKEMLETANKNIETTKAMIEEEQSVMPRIDAKVSRWESEYKRIKHLYDDKIVDKQVLDETKHQYDGAKGEQGEVNAKVLRAKAANEESIAKMKRAKADVEVAKSKIVVANADEKESEDWRNYKYIRAPFTGVITERIVHTRRMVKPVQGGEKGDSLFTIVRMDIMRVQVDVPEADAIYIKAGDPARIVIQAQENETVGFRGDINTTVTRISYALDPTARTMRVEMQLDNSKYHLLPEMYAYAYIPIVYKNVWALPESAIVQKEEQGSFIFRNVDGMAVFTPVKLGKRADKEVQLLKYQEKPASPGSKGVWRDFTGGEQVIMNPVGFVDGVKIEQSEPAN